jgi:hypothetical protein
MAIVQNPITGRTRGKFASAVFSKQFGKNTMRSKPIEVRNPKTAGQVTQRTKFTECLDFFRPILSTIRLGWKERAVGKSAFNACQGYNLKNAFADPAGPPYIEYDKIRIADGTLEPLLTPTLISTVVGLVEVNWGDNIGVGNALATDKISLVLYNPSKDEFQENIGGKQRDEFVINIFGLSGWSGDDVYAYAFCRSADGLIASTSQYCGQVTVV